MTGIGAVILAGGKSRRMGTDKASLPWAGKTFLAHMAEQLRDLDELLISAGAAEQFQDSGWPVIPDREPDRGPIGGLYSALLACRSDWLLALSCDMPLFKKELANYLIARISPAYDALVTVTRDGQLHPLCGVYAKGAAAALAAQMAAGNYRMLDAVYASRFLPVSLAGTPYPDAMVSNINTPEQYALAKKAAARPPVLAISGVKNSGKTTALSAIVTILSRRGLRVAVVKHDGHDFVPDVPGTDSFRLRAAGAAGVAVYSSSRYMLTKTLDDLSSDDLSLEWLLRQFADMDLILLEGGKFSPFPKIEIVRGEVSASPVCDPATLVALCTDQELPGVDVPRFGLSDYEGLAGGIIAWMGKTGGGDDL
ncbi:MAG: molybdopterin-guanine dinucleotide biosynthesis protein B [Peptococcaceae bacterium]|nr:molybdopterin-guanine dinucleotide biosynthesis protein B [Peptococcaceae bacterium]